MWDPKYLPDFNPYYVGFTFGWTCLFLSSISHGLWGISNMVVIWRRGQLKVHALRYVPLSLCFLWLWKKNHRIVIRRNEAVIYDLTTWKSNALVSHWSALTWYAAFAYRLWKWLLKFNLSSMQITKSLIRKTNEISMSCSHMIVSMIHYNHN